MKITKNENYYLFQNEKGEYHLSIKKYNELGEEKAKEFAQKEIDKKLSSSYKDIDIDFKRARDLGFCEFGIKDFAKKLNLNINETYKISFLKDSLNKEAFLSYPNECLKLFGNSVFDKFGGPKSFLTENRTRNVLNLILNKVLSEKEMHLLSYKFALRCVDKYESLYPEDNRVRNAIEAKRAWINGEITDEELEAARSAARSAAESAWSAARSARSAAWSAARSARSAAWSAARSAWSAAESARLAAESARLAAWAEAESARLAAESAELEVQIEMVLALL